MATEKAKQPTIIRLNPTQYAHLLDNNTNVTRVLIGPKTHARQDHESIQLEPQEMILVPPRQYCIVRNPAVKDSDGNVQFDKSNMQVKLQYGEEEVRFEGPPFPMYPGEELVKKSTPLEIVDRHCAFKLKAKRDFRDAEAGVDRVAGDIWHFVGPATFYPRVEVERLGTVVPIIVQPGEALKLRARKELTDAAGVERKAGEEWLMREAGEYLPGVFEEVVGDAMKPFTLTDKRALHLRALRNFTDCYNKQRRAGEEWLLTTKECTSHIQDVHEEVVNSHLELTVLTKSSWCIVKNVWNEQGEQEIGKRELRRGKRTFFLKPGEELETIGGSTIQEVYVLSEEEALLLKAKTRFTEDGGKERGAGEVWNIRGPCEYVPDAEVEVVKRYARIPLGQNEGIYVRNKTTGEILTKTGETYLLDPDEELWHKPLPAVVECLIQSADGAMKRDPSARAPAAPRHDKSRAVTFKAPHNTAVQVYDYGKKQHKIVLGPELIMLQPEEEFTCLTLSGGTPKQPEMIDAICIRLGPDFMTDVVEVETSDHARLKIQMSYNWYFEVDKTRVGDAAVGENNNFFQVPDFVGDTCKTMASRVRGAVAQQTFDVFHKKSTEIIHTAVFGKDDKGDIKKTRKNKENNLVLTNVDIQSVEPIDSKTKEALANSVQQAIEITTMSQEANAKHQADREEQDARGRLERQRLKQEVESEKEKHNLVQLQANSEAASALGKAKAAAESMAMAAKIENEASLERAKMRQEEAELAHSAEMRRLREKSRLEHESVMEEIERQKELNEIKVKLARQLADIEVDKFTRQVQALGSDTIKSVAIAGPELQAKLLQGLGLKSTLITDGSSPINLFNTANGLIGVPQGGGAAMAGIPEDAS